MISFLYSAEKTLTDHVSALLTRNVQGNIKIFGAEAKLKYELSLCQLPWSIHFNKKWYEKLYMIYSKNKYVYIMRIFKSRRAPIVTNLQLNGPPCLKRIS